MEDNLKENNNRVEKRNEAVITDMTRVHIPNEYGHHSHHLNAFLKKKHKMAAAITKGGHPEPMLSTPKRATTITQHLDASKCSGSSKEARDVMRLEPLVGFFLLFYTYRISFYHFRPLRMLADTYFVLILIVFITCNILYTLFLNSMIPIYPKKCKKSKKSKKKGSGLKLYKKISLF